MPAVDLIDGCIDITQTSFESRHALDQPRHELNQVCETLKNQIRHSGLSIRHHRLPARDASHCSTTLARHPTQPGESLIGSGNSPRRRRRQRVARLKPT
jgi:hypothetical protein